MRDIISSSAENKIKILKGMVKTMENYEKVEKLRERANVTYEEAKQALEECNWDILDAIILLEKSGKAKAPQQESVFTQKESKNINIEVDEEKKSSIGDTFKRFGNWIMEIIEKGNNNSFCVIKETKEIFKVPVTVLVLFLFFAFWVVVPLLIVGLFFNMRYQFVGPNMHSVDIDINKAMDAAADATDNIKAEFNNAVSKEEK